MYKTYFNKILTSKESRLNCKTNPPAYTFFTNPFSKLFFSIIHSLIYTNTKKRTLLTFLIRKSDGTLKSTMNISHVQHEVSTVIRQRKKLNHTPSIQICTSLSQNEASSSFSFLHLAGNHCVCWIPPSSSKKQQ